VLNASPASPTGSGAKPSRLSASQKLLLALGLAALVATPSLKPELEKRRQEGLGLLERADTGLTQQELLGWEAAVKHVLRDDHDQTLLFLYDPSAATAATTWGPDVRRLRARLEQLEKVIQSS
jgi:hypothetical protein